jgi:hypothetical protein
MCIGLFLTDKSVNPYGPLTPYLRDDISYSCGTPTPSHLLDGKLDSTPEEHFNKVNDMVKSSLSPERVLNSPKPGAYLIMHQIRCATSDRLPFNYGGNKSDLGRRDYLTPRHKHTHQRPQLTGLVKIKFPDYQFDKMHPPTASHYKPSIIREFHGDVSEVTTWKISNLTAVVARIIIVPMPCGCFGGRGVVIAHASVT